MLLMPLSISQFFDRLRISGVLAEDEVETLAKKIPKEKRGHDAEKIVPKLIEAKKLTAYQADEILAGREGRLALGDYVILSKIGAGGMGQVFKARHRRMKRVVALKVLPAAVTDSADAIRRFQREVEAAAKLSHPNIVQAHDAGEQKGIHYLVMEFVDGDDLARVVKQRGPLPAETAVGYIVQAARGLSHAHAQGVVHRDIKPANLLLDSRGAVKILDMGLARFEGATEEGDEGLTQSGTLMGTIDFMSPEQALDTKSAGPLADVYSLGCTLFFLLTGKRMYDGDTMMKRLVAHRDEPIPSLASERGDLPCGIADVFERMVAKRPQDRWQSMNDVSAALLATLETPAPAARRAAAGEMTSTGVPQAVPPAPPLPPPIASANTVAGQAQTGTHAASLEPSLNFSFGHRQLSTHASRSSAGPGNMVLRICACVSAAAILVALVVVVWNLNAGARESKKASGGVAKGSASKKEPVKPTGSPTLRPGTTAAGVTATATGAGSGELKLRPLGSVRVRQGQTETLKVTIERVNCAGAVQVQVNGPSYVVCPNETIDHSQDSGELRISAATDAPLGESRLTAVASLGTLTALGPLLLTVDKAPALRVSPLADETLKAGESRTVRLRVEREGYTGPIQVMVAGLPSSVSVKNGGDAIAPGKTSGTLEFVVSKAATSATHELQVVASGGGLSGSQPLVVSVAGAPPAGGVAEVKVAPAPYVFDAKAKDLTEYESENARAAYEGKNFVLELGHGKRINASVTVGGPVSDFDCEARCRLTGNAGGIRLTVVFRDSPPPAGDQQHLTVWVNHYDQSNLVRQSWTLAKPGEPAPVTRELRISQYEKAFQWRHDGWNKLRVRARGPLVETLINDKVFSRYTVGGAGYKPDSMPIRFWLTKDKEEDQGKLELSDIKITPLGGG
jgi:serine/threonine protein kinase